MTNDELKETLTREYPNGVSFDPMALRLLRQKITFGEEQVEDLKSEMIQLGDKLWFSSEMIANNEILFSVRDQATKWLTQHGCFSVERLYEGYRGMLRHISTKEECATFLRHLGFTVAAWGKCGLVCFQPPSSLGERLTAISKTIAELIAGADGMLALSEIEEAVPYLTAEALEGVRAQSLPGVHAAEVGGVSCWRNADAIPLPEDFAEKLTTAVDTLVALDENVSAAKLEFALNLFYCMRFREEFALTDNGTFMRVCAKYYQGGQAVFSNTRKACEEAGDLTVKGKRMRSPNTRFINLGVPIGTELVFARDSQITCTVRNESNQVEYDGKAWGISALAKHLLKVSAANGFCHFSYDGETLWERRLRLERETNKDKCRAEKLPPPAKGRVAKTKP